MYSLFYCIRDQHDPRLIVLAGMLCFLSAAAAILLARRAASAEGRQRVTWLTGAGVCAGTGVWATHFVAMLGYDPGIAIGYDYTLTLGSLLVAVVVSVAGFNLAGIGPSLPLRLGGGAIVGCGLAIMHYAGMAAVEMPGIIRWSSGPVVLSVALAIALLAPAVAMGLRRGTYRSGAPAALLFALGVLGLHFVGMTAATVIPSAGVMDPAHLISPLLLAAMIAAAGVLLLGSAIFAASVSLRVQAVTALREREFRILVQGISDCAIYMLTPDGRVANWNAGAQRLKGYTSAEAIGLPLEAFYSPEERAAGKPAQALEQARAMGGYASEGWRLRKDGSRFWAHATIEPVHDESGTFRGFAKITRDMTAPKEDHDRLNAIRANLDAALANMHQGLCLFGKDHRLILWNRRFCDIYGLPEEDLAVGMHSDEVIARALGALNGGPVPEERLALALHRLGEALASESSLTVEYANGMHVFMAHRLLGDGGWVSTYEDVTAHRRSEARIAHMALHDELTGLPNRSHFGRRLDEALESAQGAGTQLAVAVIDLDRFKEVNDSWGHSVGDLLLQKISARLREEARGHIVFARLGGDEFGAFFGYEDEDDLRDQLARIEACFTEQLDLGESMFSAGASIGISLYPGDGTNREQILNNADLAMYRAKSLIGQHSCFYEQEMDEKARARRQIANDLRQAIERDELSLAYQVQRSISSGEVTGYEALLRWNHSQHGPIGPDDFIPIAEETGEILRLGAWVLREACREAATWDQPWKIAVNLSPIQLLHVDLIELVIRTLAETGLPAHRLELEITESAIIGDKLRALHILRSIKALGVTIAIDDFGTGYSSLDTLNSFPFDKIKIDKSFLLESGDSPQARAIIRAVLALGRSLEVPVLAEGLESEDQLDLLRAEGCDEAQGYLFGRPRPASDIPRDLTIAFDGEGSAAIALV